jgi:prepilin-type N-terminal cleavage/methylation domain-containing protein
MTRRRAHSGRARRCFTLVELLVVITIIAIIAGMLVMALAGAAESSRANRTTAQIAKLDQIIMDRWNSYRTRPLPIRSQDIAQRFGQPQPHPNIIARYRLGATWELMRMELPERKSDLIDLPGNQPNYKILRSPPALWHAYRARATALCGPNWQDDISGWTPAHQGAECLYLIVATMRDGDTSALAYFSQSEIGDVDNDKMPEILDAWGNPIEFLRWAPGFVPVPHPPPPAPANPKVQISAGTKRQSGDAINQHCPFDTLKAFPEAFALFPLIYSAGPDGAYDINVGAFNSGGTAQDLVYSQFTPSNNPYFTLNSDPNYSVPGIIADTNQDNYNQSEDNLTNHFIEVR